MEVWPDATGLEWQTPSPPPKQNFLRPPRVTAHPYEYHALDAPTKPVPELNGNSEGSISAESELGVLSAQCLDRRIPDKQTLIEEIAAWEHDRNANHTKADWQFTSQSARVKLKYLYPSI